MLFWRIIFLSNRPKLFAEEMFRIFVYLYVLHSLQLIFKALLRKMKIKMIPKNYKIILTCNAVGHKHERFRLKLFLECAVLTLQRDLDGADFPYWASCIDMLVPDGHLRVMVSSSQAAFWNVRSVPDKRAAIIK